MTLKASKENQSSCYRINNNNNNVSFIIAKGILTTKFQPRPIEEFSLNSPENKHPNKLLTIPSARYTDLHKQLSVHAWPSQMLFCPNEHTQKAPGTKEPNRNVSVTQYPKEHRQIFRKATNACSFTIATSVSKRMGDKRNRMYFTE